VEAALGGATVRSFERRGKYLIWNLGKRGRVVAHLGMTGKFVFREGGEPPPRSARAVFSLARGAYLWFVDARRLGSLRLWDEKVEAKLSRMGPEPLESTFTPVRLKQLLTGARRPIKTFLMDQHRVAGLGNIHTAEALFRARIHPARQAADLSREEVVRLHRSIRATLSETLRRERSDEIPYLQERDVENEFIVYGREGEPCRRCRMPIERLLQAGRSSYFCPRCQPLP
jgi:formamidopyrimidine-DNA glycosylase